jgi:hypothetical protein
LGELEEIEIFLVVSEGFDRVGIYESTDVHLVFFGDELAFDSESAVCNFLPAVIRDLLEPIALFVLVSDDAGLAMERRVGCGGWLSGRFIGLSRGFLRIKYYAVFCLHVAHMRLNVLLEKLDRMEPFFDITWGKRLALASTYRQANINYAKLQ